MVNYREILRLHSLGQSQRTIRSSAHCSDNTVRTVLEVASQKGIQWPLDDDITNADLERMLFPDKYKSACLYIEPDYPYIHRELAKHGVTLTLLLEEYRRKCYDESKKPYIACALGVEACNAGLKVKYVRLPDLLSELELSRIQGTYRNKIRQYERCDLLILDEWLLVTTNNIEQQDILEGLEKRYRVHSTILCSQFDVAGWHSKLGGGALADAILDRIVSKSQTIKIKGDKSMRSR